jgi:hypothetical protein
MGTMLQDSGAIRLETAFLPDSQVLFTLLLRSIVWDERMQARKLAMTVTRSTRGRFLRGQTSAGRPPQIEYCNIHFEHPPMTVGTAAFGEPSSQSEPTVRTESSEQGGLPRIALHEFLGPG